MKRTLLLCLALFTGWFSLYAQPVDLETAQAVAAKFLGTNDLVLSTTYKIDNGIPAMYVFNTANGFAIVAADRCETPIVGYSREGCFDPDNVPVQMREYLQDFTERIQYGIEHHVAPDEVTVGQWERVLATGQLACLKSSHYVTPLLTAKWNQGCLYNNLCPEGQGPCDHYEVGCIAVAMGQIMHYWGYPTRGFGSKTYHNLGVLLSADFGNTTYDWEHMPDSLSESSSETEVDAVATLLFHCGVAVQMFYGPGGSTSTSTLVPDVLVRNFNYSRRLHFERQSDFSDEEWLSMMKDCLDLGQPVYYTGHGSQGGHAFVCDGYDDNDLLHFNWGWGVANGYFALGNLYPNGYDFNKTSTAILDIYPHYDPCLVVATAQPSNVGTVEGAGEYHIGETCTLTATTSGDYEFYAWLKDGQILSSQTTVTFSVEEAVVNVVAQFVGFPVGEITATYSPDTSNPNGPNARLAWSRADTEWKLLRQIPLNGESAGLATDGEYIYVSYSFWDDYPFMLEKYTMDGELIEMFNIEGLPNVFFLVYDGTDFYCNSHDGQLCNIYRIDLDNKMVLDTTADVGRTFWTMAYDPEYDGFWIGNQNRAVLCNRQGQIIKTGPSSNCGFGMGYYVAKDGNPHLLLPELSCWDYDIHNDLMLSKPLLWLEGEQWLYYGEGYGACTAKYEGKDVFLFVLTEFFSLKSTIFIYEINNVFLQIIGYRIYRSDSEGNTVMLADGINGSAYLDQTWAEASAGNYRFGISELYSNGVESEIKWSNTLLKTDFGVDEDHGDVQVPSVRKVIENNQIVIIKDGKKYNVSGQLLFDR